jgi:hypothetical protein
MLVSGLALGLIAGVVVRRTWRPLLDIEVRWLPVLLGSLVLRAIAPFFGTAGLPMYDAALLGTSVSALMNPRLVGASLVAVGGLLNLSVVLLNAGMPVDLNAVASAGAQMPLDGLHRNLTPGSQLGLLADIIPIALVRGVYSVGDVVIASGAFLVPFLALARR